ncbi:hypothetical protein ETAA8_32830 [Anatilimnocola aggregata]|uniref:Uncharacterized protein n=1 Tax=Anatilimnocola aggregata TaxID=2528021 RepID=A0A517YD73_9BACT|nr:sigma-70 family RNA polymerase sigma factor [Anatilimnocola aggregata]QDU28183.1 hypothetical protein ETAA8_32830 [Anatilimnocola aggregata]
MVADLKVPPSERDFQAFRLIKVEQRTTRAVAELLGISQTRVCQIVQRVLEFLIETAPTADDEARRAQAMYVAKEVAADRFDFLFRVAMQSWEDSKGYVTTSRSVGRDSRSVSTTRRNYGDVQYLSAAVRINVMAAKMTASRLPPWQAVTSENEVRPEKRHKSAAVVNEPAVNHPVEDCSTRTSQQPAEAPCEIIAELVSRENGTVSRAERFAFRQHRESEMRTVQEEQSEAATSAAIPLNRHQRRARQALLAKKLAGRKK